MLGWDLRRTKAGDDRGATLIEASLVFPILILIVMAVLELGMFFKDYLAVAAMSREGARVAALAGTHDQADCAVVLGIANMVTQRDLERISEVRIFKADPGTGTPALTNVWVYNGGDPDQCNQPALPGDGWDNLSTQYPVGPGRQAQVGVVGGTELVLDLVGVSVHLDSEWITGFPPFRGSFGIDEATITRLEPEAFVP
ncbi:MAG: pilus assembly protein [Actinobacteria bacterium]|nr:pilus assembly protein [Actinomycetota bacterium]